MGGGEHQWLSANLELYCRKVYFELCWLGSVLQALHSSAELRSRIDFPTERLFAWIGSSFHEFNVFLQLLDEGVKQLVNEVTVSLLQQLGKELTHFRSELIEQVSALNPELTGAVNLPSMNVVEAVNNFDEELTVVHDSEYLSVATWCELKEQQYFSVAKDFYARKKVILRLEPPYFLGATFLGSGGIKQAKEAWQRFSETLNVFKNSLKGSFQVSGVVEEPVNTNFLYPNVQNFVCASSIRQGELMSFLVSTLEVSVVHRSNLLDLFEHCDMFVLIYTCITISLQENKVEFDLKLEQ
eukprot:snap_masked-scaffold_15-processed-gene-3.8-mRNA-1 protein AED:1.00 eAED:1.00 QI:0/0/0/0/1/1/2/0/297